MTVLHGMLEQTIRGDSGGYWFITIIELIIMQHYVVLYCKTEMMKHNLRIEYRTLQ